MGEARGARAALAAAVAIGLTLLAGCGSAASKPVISPKIAVAGATAKTILVGGIAPLTGDGATVAAGSQAYFRFVNAHGGVYGRRIVYRVLDDRGQARLAPSLALRLVQRDAVFAMFGVEGTAANVAVARYLNASGVPDVFAGSGCGCLSSQGLPYTFGWQLGDIQEGKLLGSYVAGHLAGEKISVLYENDKFGRDELAGLMAERLRISARVACPADGRGAGSCARALRASGARAVVVLASPAVKQALGRAMAGLGYHPQLVVSGTGDARMGGVITDGFLPSLAAPRGSAGASWIRLFRQVHDQYIPHVPFDAAVVTGMSAAYEFTAAMFRAGPDPTRGKLLGAMSGMAQGPAVAPLVYSTGDHLGITGGYVGVMRAGVLVPLTTVLSTDDNITGPVAPERVIQAGAPATGIPAH